jgi:hypothetical protein
MGRGEAFRLFLHDERPKYTNVVNWRIMIGKPPRAMPEPPPAFRPPALPPVDFDGENPLEHHEALRAHHAAFQEAWACHERRIAQFKRDVDEWSAAVEPQMDDIRAGPLEAMPLWSWP